MKESYLSGIGCISSQRKSLGEQNGETVISCLGIRWERTNSGSKVKCKWRTNSAKITKNTWTSALTTRTLPKSVISVCLFSFQTLSNNSLNRIQNAQAQVIPNNQQMYYPNAYSVNGQSNEEDVEYRWVYMSEYLDRPSCGHRNWFTVDAIRFGGLFARTDTFVYYF